MFLGCQEMAVDIEKCEAQRLEDYAHAHQKLNAGSKVTSISVGEGAGLFAGVASPLTQAMGFWGADPQSWAVPLVNFFRSHGSETLIGVSSLTQPEAANCLLKLGFTIRQYGHVLVLPLTGKDWNADSNFDIHLATSGQRSNVASLLVNGFLDGGQSDQLNEIMEVRATISHVKSFYATENGQTLGAANLYLKEPYCFLTGASTLPAYRNQGVQKALTRARLEYAQKHGSRFVVVTTEPGSISQQNMSKLGFQIAYTRNRFVLPFSDTP